MRPRSRRARAASDRAEVSTLRFNSSRNGLSVHNETGPAQLLKRGVGGDPVAVQDRTGGRKSKRTVPLMDLANPGQVHDKWVCAPLRENSITLGGKWGRKMLLNPPSPFCIRLINQPEKKSFAATLWGFISVIDVSRDFRYDCAWALSGNVCAIASDGLQKSRPRMIDSYRSAPPYTPLCALPV